MSAVKYDVAGANVSRLAEAFKDVPRVDLSIACVLEGKAGTARVDDVRHPTSFEILVGPFAYFAGDPRTEAARSLIQQLAPGTIVMPSAEGWMRRARELLGDSAVALKRFSYPAGGLSGRRIRLLLEASECRDQIIRMDRDFTERIWGASHFVDISCFKSADDFVERGIGFTLRRTGNVIGAAYSSLACSRGIEVSLYVAPSHRRRGFGLLLAAALIEWCLDRDMEPHWDAANPESCLLAEKIGYDRPTVYESLYVGN